MLLMPKRSRWGDSMKFDIAKLEGFGESERVKFLEILKNGEEVLASDYFKERVLNYQWVEYYRRFFRQYSRVHNTFNWNNGLSNDHILSMLLSGSDQLNPTADGDIDLSLELYFKNNSVIGYTAPNIQTIYINKKYFLPNLRTIAGHASIFNNIIHEYMHKVGFDHTYFNNATRRFTVPYAMGDIAEGCYLNHVSRGGKFGSGVQNGTKE
jgi:hypothetical protein